MISKEYCIQKYLDYKKQHGRIPKIKEFLEFAKTSQGRLDSIFGREAYSKLQKECGDEANKLRLEKIPLEKIFRQYGDLVLELQVLPKYPDWSQRGLKPSHSGLAKVHSISWTDFPRKFLEWVGQEQVKGYEKVIELIKDAIAKADIKNPLSDTEFARLLSHIREWSPGRRRNSEETYKVELRAYLESLGYKVDEEHGQSNIDLLVDKRYMIETKKSPILEDYDRLFGQLARHLQQQKTVIALIFDPQGKDHFVNFSTLVDAYFNNEKNNVEVIKK